MANRVVPPKMTDVADIKCGKIDLALKARVIHLWSVPDKNNPAEEGSIHMLLLDEKGGKIHATIKKNLIPLFKDQIEEGSAYVLESFMVASNDHAYRSTDHKYKLSFMGGTMVFRVSCGNIPEFHFKFVPFAEILAEHKEDKLLDVIGHLAEKDVIKETEKNGKRSKVMDVILEDLESTRVHCTLWGSYAEKMQSFIDSHDASQSVIVVLQLCKLKKFYGVMGVSNAFHGTKMLLNAEIPAVTKYMTKLNETDVALTQVVSQISGPTVLTLSQELLQCHRMTIDDLIESTEKCVGSVLARTCELEADLGWYYQACTKCASRVITAARTMYCGKCKMPRTAVPRFKVHVQVMDNTGSTTFILFDRVVSQVLGRNVQELLDGMENRNDTAAYPNEMNIFVDKRMLFKVEVSDANLFRNWRSYTVKKLTGDDEIIKNFLTLHGLDMSGDEDHGICTGATSHAVDTSDVDILEGGDSNLLAETLASSETPTSKALGKRPIASSSRLDSIVLSAGEFSATKEPKLSSLEDKDPK